MMSEALTSNLNMIPSLHIKQPFKAVNSTPTWLVAGILMSLCALLFSGTAWALPEDRNQPIRLKADQAEMDEQKGISVYQGNVFIKQGTLEITADTVTVHSDKLGIKLIVAVGKPARFQQLTKPDSPLTKGRALTLEYHADKDRVVLIKEAHLNQGEDIFKGDHIQYDMLADLVNATSDSADSESQVEILLMPRNQDDAAK